jgi:hypothetical protein
MTITLTRDEAQQVLDAFAWELGGEPLGTEIQKAVELLRARLAQPEPEPVAWFIEGTYEDGTPCFIQTCETDPEFYVPLYTAPPQREWQGLTDEEIRNEAKNHVFDESFFSGAIWARGQIMRKNNG